MVLSRRMPAFDPKGATGVKYLMKISLATTVSLVRSSWNCDRMRLCLLSIRSHSHTAGFRRSLFRRWY